MNDGTSGAMLILIVVLAIGFGLGYFVAKDEPVEPSTPTQENPK